MATLYAPAWQKFIDEFGENPKLTGSLDEIQQTWDKLLLKLATRYQLPPTDESVQTSDVTLENSWARIYRPPATHCTETIGIYIHGGGWTMGSVEGEDAICRLMCKSSGMTMVSVSYRLAPQSKCPAALDDCVEAALWAIGNFSASSILLTGTSAGGNLAFGAALRLIDQGMAEKVKGVLAMVPLTVHPDAVPEKHKMKYTSMDEHADNTINTKLGMRTFLDTYGATPEDQYFSPLLHPRLKDLKKVYITESGCDTLRDDARLMKDVLEAAGVPVAYDAYPGFPHYSWTFPSPTLADHQKEFFDNMLCALQWLNG
ncbi:alpha/beta hydrolase fold-domain-containing protein [Aspergillus ambiguus]|uniref:alpha/beta hydrolase n=1 Tax=Aspergillus ambiguus TaxID=176160 RepID=UPI003CCD84E9